MSASSSTSRPQRELTRLQIAERIAQGETLVLRGRIVYKLDSWLSKHPGGELAILHFVGRDASDEIEVYHSEDTLRRMSAFAIATLAEADWIGPKQEDGSHQGYRPLLPPVQLGYRHGKLEHPQAQQNLWRQMNSNVSDDSTAESSTDLKEEAQVQKLLASETPERPTTFPLPLSMLEPPEDPPEINPAKEQAVSRAFKELHAEVKRAGLYELHPDGYARECLRYLCLGAAAFYFWYTAEGRTLHFLASSFFLGLFWHQLTFTAHDAGHTGITHNHAIDRAIGICIADLIGGLSIGWWCDNHDVHHLVTNHPEHDPDIQHLPFFAISPQFFKQAKGEEMSESEKSIFTGVWSSYYRRILTFDAPARLFLRAQHQLYYIVMSLGRFNLYANSYGFLLLKAKNDKWLWLESISLAIFWSWFGAVLASCPSWGVRISYLLISHIVTSPLHVQVGD